MEGFAEVTGFDMSDHSDEEESDDEGVGGVGLSPPKVKVKPKVSKADVVAKLNANDETNDTKTGNEIRKQQENEDDSATADASKPPTSPTANPSHPAEPDCIICFCEPRKIVLMPCRHLCLCRECCDEAAKKAQFRCFRCPMCRGRVSHFLDIG